MSIVVFDGVTRAYRKGQPVLEDVSFTVEPGEVVGLLGANGAGKTTLLRLALGLLAPQAGALRVFDVDPRQDPLAVKRRVGFVAEDQVLPEFLRVDEVLRLHRGLFPDWDDALAADLFRRFGLDGGARIKQLSKGQARQVALLCAVAHRPPLLVLDEPAGGLDPAVRREFLETAIQLLNESGSTILFSSHHMGDVERLADRVLMLHGARVLIDQPLDALRESFSLVLLPAGRHEPAALQGLPGCLAARRVGESLHAVFQLEPEAARAAVSAGLGDGAVRASGLPLEEMFVELVGGRS
ncbi:MAG: ABC transporter ATP-binding protein [Candidatus Latescibacteria bacterium]|nr:ABC transporter ATP-binding protein [bacterium]MCB9516219.1 ABC transporter ATP-binding protein [Candidatus Latescibacterota bacterium]